MNCAGLNDFDRRMLQLSIVQAEQARLAGDRPFGAVIAGDDGRIRAIGRNHELAGGDITAHAETDALRHLARGEREHAHRLTLYASGEPCPMCAAAIFYSGVRRVVFAVDAATMQSFELPEAAILGLGCRDVFVAGSHPVSVVGPVELDQGLEVLRRYFGA